jgi:hypothetical protein
VGPASVLAHGGGDSYAFCDDEGDWIDGDWDWARTAGDCEVHVGHGGGRVALWQVKDALYGYVYMLCGMR